jgi:hypothetical protein
MSTSGGKLDPDPGHDILARYLSAYAQARKLTDLERPWGLGDGGLDALWMRLAESLVRDPEEPNRLISEEFAETDRARIVETLAPLLFALPLRELPTEVRALRAGNRLQLTLRRWGRAFPLEKKAVAKSAASEPLTSSTPDGEPGNKPCQEHALGFLPAALTEPLVRFLRRVLRFGEDEHRRVAVVSSGGRRRRVRVTILAHERGVVIRFLERLPSPVDG